MNRSFLHGFLLAALIFVVFGQVSARITEAQAAGGFGGVMPFWTSGGWFGLFNQYDGKIYFYDEKMEKCLMTVRLDKLGDPLVKE